MAVIHHTTLTPSKLDLLTRWLPDQPWYRATGGAPALRRVGGFRLDDPRGEVGIEFMAVLDAAGERPTIYHVPMTYHGADRPDARQRLLGQAEHGVLGNRWIYDGASDPVLLTQLVALMQGAAEPQAQAQSHTPDPHVTGHPVTDGELRVVGCTVAADGPHGTDLLVETADARGTAGQLLVTMHRILQPAEGTGPFDDPDRGGVTAHWQAPDGTGLRGVFATARYTPAAG